MHHDTMKQVLEVFLTLQVTKELPRQGFINFGFKRNESDSVAAHSFTVCALSFFLAKTYAKEGKKINPEHALSIALIHDMGEAISGDIGYHVKRVAGKLLDQVEEKTMDMLISRLDFRDDILDLYHEYKDVTSSEARIVKLADALDAWTQMLLTPGADLSSQTVFVDDKAQMLKNDPVFGDDLEDFFRTACSMLRNKEVTFLGT